LSVALIIFDLISYAKLNTSLSFCLSASSSFGNTLSTSSIWFGARAGYLREILQEYSLEILKTIRENNITLAYKTSRIIKDEK